MTHVVSFLLEALRTKIERYSLLRDAQDIKAFFIHNSDRLPIKEIIDFQGWRVLVYRDKNSPGVLGISSYKQWREDEEGVRELITIDNVWLEYKAEDIEVPEGKGSWGSETVFRWANSGIFPKTFVLHHAVPELRIQNLQLCMRFDMEAVE